MIKKINKEVDNRNISVERSYFLLEVGGVFFESEKYRAIMNVIEIGEMIEDSRLRNRLNTFENGTMISDLKKIEEKEKRLLRMNKDKSEYLDTFRKVLYWMEGDPLEDDGLTYNQKLKYLKEKVGNDDEETPVSRRFSFNEILKRNEKFI